MQTKSTAVSVRSQNVSHVLATSNLEGARPSRFMEEQLSDYRSGRISSAELIEAAKARYGCR